VVRLCLADQRAAASQSHPHEALEGLACKGAWARGSMRHIPEDVYKRVLQQLTEATADLETRPFAAGVTAVLAAMDLLDALHVPPGVQKPFERAAVALMDAHYASKHGDKPGPKPKPWLVTVTLSEAAATVTALKDCGMSLDEAIKRVSKETKIDGRRLRTLRDNIHRGRADVLLMGLYRNKVEDLKLISKEGHEEELLENLRQRSGLC
jgi:hypothetical protein